MQKCDSFFILPLIATDMIFPDRPPPGIFHPKEKKKVRCVCDLESKHGAVSGAEQTGAKRKSGGMELRRDNPERGAGCGERWCSCLTTGKHGFSIWYRYMPIALGFRNPYISYSKEVCFLNSVPVSGHLPSLNPTKEIISVVVPVL